MTKYIFDFDDVLFHNTALFKKHMYRCFEEVGVSFETVRKYYPAEIAKGFIMRNLVASVLHGENITSISPAELTQKIMQECKNFVNQELIAKIKILGAENCFIVTHGEPEFQHDKIERAGIRPLFSEIHAIQNTKKDKVEGICQRFKSDEIVFVDDREKRFADLDFNKYPNLRVVLYVGPESVPEIFR